MNLIHLPRFIVVLFFCLLAGCQKELSLDVAGNGSTTAVFSIANFETGCPAMTVNGHYVKGVALTSGESITVEVAVTKTGQWEFSSNVINGISFSGAGSFSNTGKQQIELHGTGTPITPGNYDFSTTGAAGYGFLIRVLPPGTTADSVGTTSFYKISFGGQEYTIDAVTQGPDNIPYGFGSRDTASFASFVSGGFYPDIPFPGTISLQKDGMLNYYGSSDADFKNFFKPGAYPLANLNECIPFANGPAGIIMALTGADDVTWCTIFGSGNQEGSSFEIVAIEDGYNKTGNYFVKVKTKFNLKLYRYETGEMRELTNGEMVSYFIKPL